MRLVVLKIAAFLALALLPAAVFANDAGQIVQFASSVVMIAAGTYGWGAWVVWSAFAVMTGAGIYGSEQARKASRAQQEQAKQVYNNGLKDRTVTSVATDTPHRTIYGRARVGSAIVAMFTSGAKDEYKHLVCVHAAHECDAIEEVYVAGKALGALDGNGDVTGGDYLHTDSAVSVEDEAHTGASFTLAHTPIPGSLRVTYVSGGKTKSSSFTLSGADVTVDFSRSYLCHYDYQVLTSRVRVTKHLGTPSDPADAALVALGVGWDTSAVLRGYCYTVVRLDLNQTEFQSGIPPIEVLVRGKKLYDIRTAITAWSQNPALAIYDYLTGEMCGIDGSSVIDLGTAQAGASSSLTLAASANATQDFYKNGTVFITSGAGAGQSRNIVSSRYSMWAYSNAPNSSYWNKVNLLAFGGGSSLNAVVAPDGKMEGHLIVENTTATVAHYISKSVSIEAAKFYSFTRHIKSYSANRNITLQIDSGPFAGIAQSAIFNPDAGTIQQTTNGATATMVDAGGGWWECTLTTISAPSAGTSYASELLHNGASVTYTGDGVSGLCIWERQLVEGAAVGEVIRSAANPAVGVITDLPWIQSELSLIDDWTNSYWAKNGVTTTATTITDDSVTVHEYLNKFRSNYSEVGQAYVASIVVQKDAIPKTTRFPALRLSVPGAGGATGYADVRFDTSDGAYSEVIGGAIVPNGVGVIDLGSEWMAWVSVTNDISVNGNLEVLVYPAIGVYVTSYATSAAATGTITARQLRLEKGAFPSIIPDSTSVYEIAKQTGDIPVADYITAANVCDESITIDGAPAAKYTINGTVSADQDPAKVLEQLAQCMAGGIVKTTWACWAGKYVAPVMALDESDIVGSLSIISGTPDADLYNGVRGQYASAENGYVVTDFKPFQNAAYVAADGRELWTNIEFPFTDNTQRIHNLCRIFCEDQRNGFTVKAAFSLKTWAIKVGQRVTFTSALFGQSAKVYRLTDKRFGPEQAVELSFKEDDASIWDTADAVVVDATPNTNLPNPFSVGPCGDVQMTEEIYETTGSAGVRSKAVLAWTAPDDATVVDYEVEYKPYTSGRWIELTNVRATFYEFIDLAPGMYDFRVKARNVLGAVGEYTAIKSFTVYGLTAAPASVSNLSVAAMAGMALASWDRTTDLDVKIGGWVVVRYCPLTTGASWEQSVVLEEFSGDSVNGIVPLATGTYYAKFRDSTGHYSDTEASFVVTEAVVTGWTTTATSTQHTAFAGAKTNVALVDGALRLDSVETIGSQVNLMSTWGMIGSLGGIQASGEYAFDATLDLGSKAARRFHAGIKALAYDTGDTIAIRGNVSTWPNISGEVINDCDATVLASVSDDNIIFAPWTPFMVADFDCRYAKFKMQMASGLSTHNIRVSELSVTVKTPA